MKTKITTALSLCVAFGILLWLNIFFINYIIFAIILVIGFLESLKLYKVENKNLTIVALALFIILPYLKTDAVFGGTIKFIVAYLTIIAGFLVYIKADNLKQILPFIYPTAPFFIFFSVYNDLGVVHFFWLILIVASCDSGSYFIGRAFGKRQLSHSSPNKTVEGAIGGLIVSIIVSTVFAKFYTHFDINTIIKISVIVAVFGIFGDLFESYLKRKADLKDSGNILPGHGGILDRIDGYIFGAIAMFLVFA